MVKIKAKNLKEAKKKAIDKYGIKVAISSGRRIEKAKSKRGMHVYEFKIKKNWKREKMIGPARPSKLHGSVKNEHLDNMLPALPPGKRISKNGKVYYEYRKNHADWPSAKDDLVKHVSKNSKVAKKAYKKTRKSRKKR